MWKQFRDDGIKNTMSNEYVYGDQDNREVVKEGPYLLEVTAMEPFISQNGGNPCIKLTVRTVEANGQCFENLVLEKKSFWKVDTFLKSCGAPVKKGEKPVLDEKLILGLRGWGHLIEDVYIPNDQSGQPMPHKKRVSNKVSLWYTMRPKLPKNLEIYQQWLADQQQSNAPSQDDADAAAALARQQQPQQQTLDDDIPF